MASNNISIYYLFMRRHIKNCAGGCWSAPQVTLTYPFRNMLLYLSHSYG